MLTLLCDQPSITSVILWFDTNLSPPLAFYEKMVDLGFKIRAYYHSYDDAICGYFVKEGGS